MSEPTITIPRARFEAVARQCLALREQVDSLSLLIQSEFTGQPVTDPRIAKNGRRPNTFNTPSDA